eukprot:7121605-Prymnesium_polylepis.1
MLNAELSISHCPHRPCRCAERLQPRFNALSAASRLAEDQMISRRSANQAHSQSGRPCSQYSFWCARLTKCCSTQNYHTKHARKAHSSRGQVLGPAIARQAFFRK